MFPSPLGPDPLVAGSARRPVPLTDAWTIHGPAVFAASLRVVRDRSLAADISQEVFLWSWQSNAFDARRGSMRGYLCTVARRRSIDEVRRRAARERSETRWAGRRPTAPVLPDDATTDVSTAQLLRRSLLDLPPKLREPLQLAYFQDLTYRQVAVALDLPEGTVKSRIREGLSRLRTCLAGEL
jgi:RNA polymerase sigma-70 factor (ECF subfamily)